MGRLVAVVLPVGETDGVRVVDGKKPRYKRDEEDSRTEALYNSMSAVTFRIAGQTYNESVTWPGIELSDEGLKNEDAGEGHGKDRGE